MNVYIARDVNGRLISVHRSITGARDACVADFNDPIATATAGGYNVGRPVKSWRGLLRRCNKGFYKIIRQPVFN